ncbi:hypothetical protein F1C58_06470 [Glaciihabitans sp. INWT7]|uniref:hypothetical protein n=1 Tax=Glaciihabitans sp. INWT7 TaxID=2596912 RepID=UPI001629CD5A|nr:hypothetical protein [Glaciihabitans sp. INWT7]QNE46585.1 hypothetical protein F1C58_06470 [Glaciihabitans sp. INWT7]
MQVIINTDHNITLTEDATSALEATVRSMLDHVAPHLTRVEVYVSDESAGRSTGNDIRCLVESRPEGLDPQSVTENAATVDLAVHGALRKMVHSLETTIGRLDKRKGASSMGGIEPR